MSIPEILHTYADLLKTKHDIEVIIERDPPRMKTYKAFNSGKFGGRSPMSAYDAELKYNDDENMFMSALDVYLSKHDQVIVVDYGGGAGISLGMIGARFSKQVDDGRLKLIVTNLESDYDISKTLIDSERRLKYRREYESLINFLNCTLGNTYSGLIPKKLIEIGNALTPILSPKEIEFMGTHKNYLIYINGADHQTLPRLLTRTVRLPQFHMMHEYFGGIYHGQIYLTNFMISDLIHPNGMLMTTAKLSGDDKTYEYLLRNRDHKLITPDYRSSYYLYFFGESPAWFPDLNLKNK